MASLEGDPTADMSAAIPENCSGAGTAAVDATDVPGSPSEASAEGAAEVADGPTGPAAPIKTKRKKKKKSKPAINPAESLSQGDVVAASGAYASLSEEAPELGDPAAISKASKNKKRRKKAKAGAAAAAALDEEDIADIADDDQPSIDVAPEKENANGNACSPALDTGLQQAEHEPVEDDDAASEAHEQDLADDAIFSREPSAKTSLSVEEPTFNILHGPVVRHAVAKNIKRGEDKFCESPCNTWSHTQTDGAAPFSAFGVFDGHGGKFATTYAAKHLLTRVFEAADRAQDPVSASTGEIEGLQPEDAATWALQDALLTRLPQACAAAFPKVDAEIKHRSRESGTTATVAVTCGWELVVASVGDSLAYLDTGAEVIQVSGNHRLDDNEEECQRIHKAGGELGQATLEGEAIGPLRVWPGGINMARTLGDHVAGSVVLPVPEVRQISLPTSGARLVIASDGLWDAVTPKAVAHNAHGVNAAQAANQMMLAALKRLGLQDDITIIVIDFLPSPSDRYPPVLVKKTAGASADASEPSTVWRPLEQKSDWRGRLQQRRQAVLDKLLAARQAEQEAAAYAAAREVEAAALAAQERADREKGVSDTYRELSQLKLNPAALSSARTQASSHARGDSGEWQLVGSTPKAGDDSGEGLATANGTGEAEVEAKAEAPPAGGRGWSRRGEERGRSGGRERRQRGRGDRAPPQGYAADHPDAAVADAAGSKPAHAEGDAAQAAHGGPGEAPGRQQRRRPWPRERGRGNRRSAEDQQQQQQQQHQVEERSSQGQLPAAAPRNRSQVSCEAGTMGNAANGGQGQQREQRHGRGGHHHGRQDSWADSMERAEQAQTRAEQQQHQQIGRPAAAVRGGRGFGRRDRGGGRGRGGRSCAAGTADGGDQAAGQHAQGSQSQQQSMQVGEDGQQQAAGQMPRHRPRYGRGRQPQQTAGRDVSQHERGGPTSVAQYQAPPPPPPPRASHHAAAEGRQDGTLGPEQGGQGAHQQGRRHRGRGGGYGRDAADHAANGAAPGSTALSDSLTAEAALAGEGQPAGAKAVSGQEGINGQAQQAGRGRGRGRRFNQGRRYPVGRGDAGLAMESGSTSTAPAVS